MKECRDNDKVEAIIRPALVLALDEFLLNLGGNFELLLVHQATIANGDAVLLHRANDTTT